MSDTTTKAICWELTCPGIDILGMRVLLASKYVGVQELSADNQRPRWKFTTYDTPTLATEAAVGLTESFERTWNAKLMIPPGEIQLYPSEVLAMANGRPISPSLRSRIFTSLQRRDPRPVLAGS